MIGKILQDRGIQNVVVNKPGASGATAYHYIIQRKADDEKSKIQNPADKQKLVDQAKSKIAELKKKHEEEKAEFAKKRDVLRKRVAANA